MQLLVVDDHKLFLESLKALLEIRLPNVTAHCASDVDAASKVLSTEKIDLAIVDYRMPGTGSQTAIQTLLSSHPQVRFALISGRATQSEILDCFSSGVVGYIGKDSDTKILINAIKQMMEGGVYLPSSLFVTNSPRSAHTDGERKLSTRELEVLALLHTGTPNKVIASKLDIQEVTVKAHIASLLKKFGVKNRTQLAVVAVDELAFRTAD